MTTSELVAGTTTPRVGAAARVLPAALLSVTLLGVNALAYVLTVLAARLLAPAAYGELAALMGLLLIGVVPASALQTVAALQLGGRHDDTVVRRLHGTTLLVALTVGAAGLLAVAPVARLLHLSPWAALWVALLLVPHTLVGGYDGMLQGGGRYARLALVSACFGTTKTAGGLAGLFLTGSPSGALAGMALGASVGAALSWAGCGLPGLTAATRPLLRGVLHACGALLGFVLLVNLDVLLARHHLPAAQAGEYAVGAIVLKVAFWLPQGIGMMLLPRLADPAGRRRALPAAAGLVAGMGALLTVVVAALGERVLPAIGGEAYRGDLAPVAWLFAALGTGLAVAQLLLYSGIATADRIGMAAAWGAAGVEVVAVGWLAGTGHATPATLVVTACASAGLLVLVGLLRQLRAASAPARPACGTSSLVP